MRYCELCGVKVTGRELRYCRECRANLPALIRAEFIHAYGGKCSCPGCDVSEPTFLSLDHIHNDGARHRRETGTRGWQMYLKIRDEGWPKDRYRLLCHNCNMSRAHFGRCVHERLTVPDLKVVSMPPTIGRIVHYRLSGNDLDRIMASAMLSGVHAMNPHREGQVLPLLVCRVWPDEYGVGIPALNGQVFLDGTESLWVTSAKEGEEPGQWSWPPLLLTPPKV